MAKKKTTKTKIYKNQQQQLICIADLQPCTVKLSGPKVMVTITAWWRTTPFTSTMRSRTSTSTSEPTSVWISLWWTARPTSQLETNRSVVQTTEHTPISNSLLGVHLINGICQRSTFWYTLHVWFYLQLRICPCYVHVLISVGQKSRRMQQCNTATKHNDASWYLHDANWLYHDATWYHHDASWF